MIMEGFLRPGEGRRRSKSSIRLTCKRMRVDSDTKEYTQHFIIPSGFLGSFTDVTPVQTAGGGLLSAAITRWLLCGTGWTLGSGRH